MSMRLTHHPRGHPVCRGCCNKVSPSPRGYTDAGWRNQLESQQILPLPMIKLQSQMIEPQSQMIRIEKENVMPNRSSDKRLVFVCMHVWAEVKSVVYLLLIGFYTVIVVPPTPLLSPSFFLGKI
eukprot:m.76861 g.76861  ORF g.76861 m.76861 type:complete len:124 (-) comp24944_c0_seq1:73-444(-)